MLIRFLYANAADGKGSQVKEGICLFAQGWHTCALLILRSCT